MGQLKKPKKGDEDKGPSNGQRAIKMLKGFDKSVWAACVTMAGQPQINRPGWEITEVVPGVFQAIAISTRYRFAGQGDSPRYALEDAVKQMHAFRDELNLHLASL